MTSSSRDSAGGELGKRLIAAARTEAPSEASLQRVMREIDQPGPAAAATDESAPFLSARHASKTRTFGALAMSAAAVSLAFVVGLLWLQQQDPAPAGTAAAPVTAARATTKTAAEVATADAAALASAAATAAPSASAFPSATATIAVAARAPRGTGRSPKASGAQSPGKAKPAAAKPPAKCGCAAADLMCNMRCAEKKK